MRSTEPEIETRYRTHPDIRAKLMNENNRRGGGVFVTAQPRNNTGVEIHQLHRPVTISSAHGGVYFSRRTHGKLEEKSWRTEPERCSGAYELASYPAVGKHEAQSETQRVK